MIGLQTAEHVIDLTKEKWTTQTHTYKIRRLRMILVSVSVTLVSVSVTLVSVNVTLSKCWHVQIFLLYAGQYAGDILVLSTSIRIIL